EVITSKNQRPSSDWLNFVVSSKAKAKIRQKLNEELGKQIQAGKELFERRMSNWKIDVNDEVLNFLVKQCKFKSIGEFYSALANGTFDIMDVKNILSSREEIEERGVGEESSLQSPKNIQKSCDGSDILIIDDKLNNVGYKLARCCNPIMGDEVFGFVTVKDGIKIHRMGCPNAARLISNYPYRVQKVKWKESSEGSNFQTSIKVSSYLDFGLSQQIMEIVNNLSISMRFFSISENKGMIEAKMQVAVPNNQVLDKLLFNLRKIKGVKSVTRITNV
ncbi:MAG TPA: hypothetical protein P5023_05475, partial [Bacteroidales bacterium]|nr:hypothetical protein [Bacteroidales bacterium]